ncbi:MAG: hypothetical protein AABW46_03810 [Nanoarchaeota archaeon]
MIKFDDNKVIITIFAVVIGLMLFNSGSFTKFTSTGKAVETTSTSSIQCGVDTLMMSLSTNGYTPAIYGSWVVYRSGSGGIRMYDLVKKVETKIPVVGFYPAIYGSKIVYHSNRGGNLDIYMYDLSTKQEKRITTDPADQSYPKIYGNVIVWEDKRHGDGAVYMYDISTGKEIRVTTRVVGLGGWKIAIYANRIAYISNDYIYTYDLSKKIETRRVKTYGGYSISIYGDTIVWADSRNGEPDIYRYSFSTGNETQITNLSSSQYFPRVYGDKTIWIDKRHGGYDVYMYSLNSKQETRLTTVNKFNDDASFPDIYDNKVVWQGNIGTGYNIYIWAACYPGCCINKQCFTLGQCDIEGYYTGKCSKADNSCP